MSAILGRVEFSDGVIKGQPFRNVSHTLRTHRSTEPLVHCDPKIAVAVSLLPLSSASPTSPQQLCYEDHLVVCDAIIDNRADLGRALGRSPSVVESMSDPELVYASFLKWGHTCPHYIEGDFSFACVNRKTRDVFLARDHIGARPLYWSRRGSSFLFSTSIETITNFTEFDWLIDERSVAEFLLKPNDPVSKTFFAGINSLTPGCSLVVTPNSLTKKRWWQPSTRRIKKAGSIEDLAKEARFLLERSVDTRIRSSLKIGSHFSGGIDSTAVTILADQSLKAQGRQLTGAYTWTPPSNARYPLKDSLDERNLLNNLATKYGLTIRHGALSGEGLIRFLERPLEFENETDLADEIQIADQAKSDEIGVMLSGWGGDEAFSSHGFGYIGHLCFAGKLKRAALFSRNAGANLQSRRALASLIWRQIIQPLLPNPLYSFSRRSEEMIVPSSISKALKFRHPGVRWNRSDQLKFGINPNQNLWRHLTWGHINRRMESWAVLSSQHGFQYRYPLTDRRLLEFLLTLPPEVLFLNDSPRGLARAIVSDFVPEEASKIDHINERLRSDSRSEACAMIAKSYNSSANATGSPWLDQTAYSELLNTPKTDESIDTLLKTISVITDTRVLNLFKRAQKNGWVR